MNDLPVFVLPERTLEVLELAIKAGILLAIGYLTGKCLILVTRRWVNRRARRRAGDR